ncbi:MAG: HTTM domain-containing protein [Polyangiaceae bacterium]
MIDRWLAGRSDVAWLATFRVLFGLTMAVSLGRFLAYGWVETFFVAPTFHFRYWGFGWLPVLGGSAMRALFVVLLGLALAVAAGAWFRITAPLFAIGFAYLQLVDVATYLNHYYLATLLAGILAASPAHGAWSVDAWRTGRRIGTVATAWLGLFRFQVAVVYTFAGLAKAQGDWLVHAEPLRIWLGSRTHVPLLGTAFTWEGVPLAMSWAGFLFDTTAPWFLLARRTRPYAYAVVILFHVVTRTLFPIGMFPVIMVVSALVFFDASWPRSVFAFVARRLLARRGTPAPASPSPSLGAPALRPRAKALLVAYAAVQIALPLRFLAYGGDVRWHEQGMRFSWRVMVREKNATVTFVVRDRSGRERHVSPSRYLTPLQEREMASQPDLILQLAHHVRDEFEAAGAGPVEVHVRALASLNGRPVAPLVDESVDLARVHDSLGKADWILEAPSSAPPHVRPVG